MSVLVGGILAAMEGKRGPCGSAGRSWSVRRRSSWRRSRSWWPAGRWDGSGPRRRPAGALPSFPGNPPERGRAPEVDLPASAVRTIATGLCVPWGVAFLPDGTALVTERRTARILSVSPGGRVTEVQRLAGLRDIGEVGLLGIAVSPSYASDRWVYVYYTTREDNRIARLHLGEEPQPILTGIPVGDFHAGGRLAFGPDGMLYASTGETYETRDIAQDPGRRAGCTHRSSARTASTSST